MSSSGALNLRSNTQAPAHFQAGQVVSRQTAIEKPQNLVPDIEKYHQLQAVLIKRIGIFTIDTASTSYRVNTAFQDSVLLGGFGASEHIAIGERIKLKGFPESNFLLVKRIAHVLFQHILALAGDFYGVAVAPISLLSGTQQKKTERVRNAFNTIFHTDNNDIRKILIELNDFDQLGSPISQELKAQPLQFMQSAGAATQKIIPIGYQEEDSCDRCLWVIEACSSIALNRSIPKAIHNIKAARKEHAEILELQKQMEASDSNI